MKKEKIKLKEKNKFTQLNLHGQEKDYMIKFKEKRKNGFTLVELLAVIVILAIILVIAVPKVMDVIEAAKKATLESTAKMIASAAEKAKVQNTVLGKTDEITCESVAKINDKDYASCDITFEDNTANVTITGSGKFEELYVCEGTKTEAKAQRKECDLTSNENNNGNIGENGDSGSDESIDDETQSTFYRYNGVKLPNINTVWIDKDTYPYAFIYETANTDINYMLVLSSEPVNAIMNGKKIDLNLPVDTVVKYYVCPSGTEWELPNLDKISLPTGLIVTPDDTLISSSSKYGRFDNNWSSYNICYDTGEIALATSKPIPDEKYIPISFSVNIPESLFRGKLFTISYILDGSDIIDKTVSISVISPDYQTIYYEGEFNVSPATITFDIPETVESVIVMVMSNQNDDLYEFKEVTVFDPS